MGKVDRGGVLGAEAVVLEKRAKLCSPIRSGCNNFTAVERQLVNSATGSSGADKSKMVNKRINNAKVLTSAHARARRQQAPRPVADPLEDCLA